MNRRLADWLRRLANRISPSPAVAGFRAGFDELRYMQRREGHA